jgi:hypothetical protein
MELHSNLPAFINNLQRIRDAVASGSAGGAGGAGTDFSDALFAALNSGMGAMKNRIFNRSLDANGESLGKYIGRTSQVTSEKYRLKKYSRNKGKAALRKGLKGSIGNGFIYTEYEKIRLANGRQIIKKDLEFLGSLRRTIETVKKEGKAQIVITNDKNALIASYQEQQIGNIRANGTGKGSAKPAPIFQLSKEEFEKVRDQGKILITEVIKKIVDNR